MPSQDQGPATDRYVVIPRTVIFLWQGDQVLLIKGSPTKRLWPGKYNGLGGHVERGEDVLSAARRELFEETGLMAELWLCGSVIIDAGDIGVSLFVFKGERPEGEIKLSEEGAPQWLSVDGVADLPVVADLPDLLGRVRAMRPGEPPFSARSYYDGEGRLGIEFAG